MSFSFSQMIDFGVNRPITNINHHASHQALFVIASHTTNWVRTSKKEFWISVGMAQVPSQMTCPTWYQVQTIEKHTNLGYSQAHTGWSY